MFWKPGGICRHLQHQGTYLFTSMLQRNTFRKQQESSTLEKKPLHVTALASYPLSSLLPPLSGLSEMTSVCAQAVISVKNYCLAHHKILTVLWQGSCYLWQLVPFQCLLLLLAVKGRNYHSLFTAASYDCFWKHFQTFPKVQADHLARNLLWT